MPDIKHFDHDTVLDTALRVFWQRGMASTGIQALVDATGLSRSSLYATFGSKEGLYTEALRRYIARWSTPAFAALAADPGGLDAIERFFAGLIDLRCSGELAGWGCLVTNAHAGPESAVPQVRALLDDHHRQLQGALRTTLGTAAALGRLAPSVDPDDAAAVLAALAYGVNLRSRAGAPPEALHATVAGALRPLYAQPS
ncbi:TetR/AcrR family transcriptional regulator [Streptomyces coeruleoprunus]|uniref:TetR/AcrR family transcriptional regulator n=1 Tax=Streptomyces coeruleoprunus TaxID=285563 RepID=A0ABV9X722_9ACTN